MSSSFVKPGKRRSKRMGANSGPGYDFILPRKRTSPLNLRKIPLPEVRDYQETSLFVSDRVICGNGNLILGQRNTVIGIGNIVIGSNNNVRGNNNDVIGLKAQVSGHFNVVRGVHAVVNGNINRIKGDHANVTGDENHIRGQFSQVQGSKNTIKPAKDTNTIVGRYLAERILREFGIEMESTKQRLIVNGIDITDPNDTDTVPNATDVTHTSQVSERLAELKLEQEGTTEGDDQSNV